MIAGSPVIAQLLQTDEEVYGLDERGNVWRLVTCPPGEAWPVKWTLALPNLNPREQVGWEGC